MAEWISKYFEHILFVLLLIARLGDVVSTYLATPTLKLEANPIVRKFRWPFAILTILLSFSAYVNTQFAVVLLILSLFVSASNLGKLWMMRTLGEYEYSTMVFNLARRSKFSHALAIQLSASFFILVAGTVTIFLCDDPDHNWGYWIGMGIITYGVAMAFYGTISTIKLFRRVKKERENLSSENR